MTTRPYHQRLRAEAAHDTRRRILDAVAQRLRDAPTEPLSLDQVAQLAKVARSTIYLVFGSRSGLLDAFADDLLVRTGLADLSEAVALPDAREHLRGGIAASCRMYAAERDIYRVLFSMAQLDPDSVGGAVRRKEHNRVGGMAHLARRLAEDGVLRDDITVDEATNLLWVLCSFDTFDLLYTGRALSVEDTSDLITSMAERALYR
jgi:AcrR family transcriptional regulator